MQHSKSHNGIVGRDLRSAISLLPFPLIAHGWQHCGSILSLQSRLSGRHLKSFLPSTIKVLEASVGTRSSSISRSRLLQQSICHSYSGESSFWTSTISTRLLQWATGNKQASFLVQRWLRFNLWSTTKREKQFAVRWTLGRDLVRLDRT